MTEKRVFNFSAGPSTLPVPVLEKAAKQMLNYENSGMSVMEMSHRSSSYLDIFQKTKDLLKKVMNVPDDYKIVFIQGGATQQFSMVPLNLLKNGKADYIITGSFSKKAANEAKKYGEISMLVNGAGVSPSQAPIEAILKVDLYGTAVLLEEVGKVIKKGGVGVTISSQSGHRMPALSSKEDELLATTPVEKLLDLEMLQEENIKDTLHAYQLAKRCNEKRVMAEAVKWGQRGARINSISPGIIVTPLAIDEFNGPRGDFYKNMFANCPAKRPGTADEVANVAELLMSNKGIFITGSDFLIDGGATASYFYGPLKPE